MKGVIILPIVVDYLTKEDLGIWRVVSSAASLIVPLVTLNLFDGSGMFLSPDFNTRSVSRKFNTLLVASLVSLFVLMLPVTWFLACLDITSNYWWVIVLLVLSMYLLKASMTLFQVYQKARSLLTITVVLEYGSAAGSLVMIYFVLKNYESLVLPVIAFNVLISLFLFRSIFKELPFSVDIDAKFLRKVVPVSLPLLPVFLGEWLLSSLSIYLLTHYHSYAEAGVYSVAFSIAGLFIALRTSLQYFWFSTASNLLQNREREKFNRIFHFVLKSYVGIIAAGIIFYIFYAGDLIRLLANKSYSDARVPILLLVTAFGLVVLANIFNASLYALGETRKILRSYIIAAGVAVVACLVLIPRYGVVGAAGSTAIGYAALLIAMMLSSKKIAADKRTREFWAIVPMDIGFVALSLALVSFLPGGVRAEAVGALVLAAFFFTNHRLGFMDFGPLKELVLGKMGRG